MADPAFCKTRLSWETVGNMCPVKSTLQVKIKDLARQTKCKDWQVALTLELVVLGVVLPLTCLVILPARLLPIQLFRPSL